MIIRNCLSPVHAYFQPTPFGKVSAKDPYGKEASADKDNESASEPLPKPSLRLPHPRGCLEHLEWKRKECLEGLPSIRAGQDQGLIDRVCAAIEEFARSGKGGWSEG
jgi:hypothetical protein